MSAAGRSAAGLRRAANQKTGPEHPPETAGSRDLDAAERSIAALIERLGSELGQARADRYFSRDASLSINGTSVVVTVRSPFHAGLIDRRFGRLLPDIVSEVLGPGFGVRTVIDPNAPGGPDAYCENGQAANGHSVEPAARAARRGPARKLRRAAGPHAADVDERYDLSRFVRGESNHLALDAAERIADFGAGTPFRQLFLHGECGNGKTHLLRGIARRVRARDESARIRCVAAEAFTNEYIQAIQANRADAFRQKHRQLDLLCIDDVHFLSRKNATQLEIMHTLDAIEFVGARLVLASDEHPNAISDMHRSLASRFLSGVVAQVHAPDRALAVSVIETFAERRGLRLTRDAAEAIADEHRSAGISVRELEGEVTNLAAAVAAARPKPPMPLGVESVRSLLSSGGAWGSQAGAAVQFSSIRDIVCETLAISRTDLGEPGRHPRVVLGRAMITLLCKELTPMSYPEIARGIGKRNHSTVITARRRIDEQMHDPIRLGLSIDGATVAELADRLKARIQSR
ncbi:MAG: DnaA/Hda family protein [Planctomycetota bacterium]